MYGSSDLEKNFWIDFDNGWSVNSFHWANGTPDGPKAARLLSPDDLRELYAIVNPSDPQLVRWIAEHPATPTDILHLVTVEAVEHIADNPHVTQYSVLHTLDKHPNTSPEDRERVRQALIVAAAIS